ncbi:hypothetical protein OIO90_000979, partial [Microbotryomycetes sp. JL221]
MAPMSSMVRRPPDPARGGTGTPNSFWTAEAALQRKQEEEKRQQQQQQLTNQLRNYLNNMALVGSEGAIVNGGMLFHIIYTDPTVNKTWQDWNVLRTCTQVSPPSTSAISLLENELLVTIPHSIGRGARPAWDLRMAVNKYYEPRQPGQVFISPIGMDGQAKTSGIVASTCSPTKVDGKMCITVKLTFAKQEDMLKAAACDPFKLQDLPATITMPAARKRDVYELRWTAPPEHQSRVYTVDEIQAMVDCVWSEPVTLMGAALVHHHDGHGSIDNAGQYTAIVRAPFLSEKTQDDLVTKKLMPNTIRIRGKVVAVRTNHEDGSWCIGCRTAGHYRVACPNKNGLQYKKIDVASALGWPVAPPQTGAEGGNDPVPNAPVTKPPAQVPTPPSTDG